MDKFLLDVCNITTGNLDSKAAVENGKYPFFTCAPEPLRIDDYAFNEDAILLAGNNAQGNFHINRYKGKFNAYQRTYVITAKENFDIDYLKYSIEISLNHLKKLSQGSQTKFLTMAILEQFKLKNIPFEKQKQQVACLVAIDKKIALNKKINENLESQLNLVYEKFFSRENEFIELGKVVETTSGGTPSRKNNSFYENATIYWVKSKELDGKYIVDTEEKITDKAVKNSSAKILPQNSVLIAMYGATVGEYGIIEKSMTCNQAICALISNKIYPYTYLYQVAKKSKDYFSKISIGSAQKNINQETIKKLLIHKNINKILEFHTFAEPIHKLLKKFENENQTLSALRDYLLPLMMNGQVTIKD